MTGSCLYIEKKSLYLAANFNDNLKEQPLGELALSLDGFLEERMMEGLGGILGPMIKSPS